MVMSCRAAVAVSMTVLVAAGCGAGTSSGYQVAEGTYRSQVPSTEQLRLDIGGSLPGGVAQLRKQGIDRLEVDINADQVKFRLDGVDSAAANIVDRVNVTDREGSGPFKAKKQLLVLGEPLVLGELVINDPVVWPGSFEQSPVITIKPRTPGERGPDVSCRADEPCLLLSSGVDPAGRYADANNPALDENPIDSILINDKSVEVTLDTGKHVTIPTKNASFTRACGLSENRMWDLPAELGLPFDDPVLVHTLCPSTPGTNQLMIMGRSAIPTLAPLTEARGGEWCPPGPGCLFFVPT